MDFDRSQVENNNGNNEENDNCEMIVDDDIKPNAIMLNES